MFIQAASLTFWREEQGPQTSTTPNMQQLCTLHHGLLVCPMHPALLIVTQLVLCEYSLGYLSTLYRCHTPGSVDHSRHLIKQESCVVLGLHHPLCTRLMSE